MAEVNAVELPEPTTVGNINNNNQMHVNATTASTTNDVIKNDGADSNIKPLPASFPEGDSIPIIEVQHQRQQQKQQQNDGLPVEQPQEDQQPVSPLQRMRQRQPLKRQFKRSGDNVGGEEQQPSPLSRAAVFREEEEEATKQAHPVISPNDSATQNDAYQEALALVGSEDESEGGGIVHAFGDSDEEEAMYHDILQSSLSLASDALALMNRSVDAEYQEGEDSDDETITFSHDDDDIVKETPPKSPPPRKITTSLAQTSLIGDESDDIQLVLYPPTPVARNVRNKGFEYTPLSEKDEIVVFTGNDDDQIYKEKSSLFLDQMLSMESDETGHELSNNMYVARPADASARIVNEPPMEVAAASSSQPNIAEKDRSSQLLDLLLSIENNENDQEVADYSIDAHPGDAGALRTDEPQIKESASLSQPNVQQQETLDVLLERTDEKLENKEINDPKNDFLGVESSISPDAENYDNIHPMPENTLRSTSWDNENGPTGAKTGHTSNLTDSTMVSSGDDADESTNSGAFPASNSNDRGMATSDDNASGWTTPWAVPSSNSADLAVSNSNDNAIKPSAAGSAENSAISNSDGHAKNLKFPDAHSDEHGKEGIVSEGDFPVALPAVERQTDNAGENAVLGATDDNTLNENVNDLTNLNENLDEYEKEDSVDEGDSLVSPPANRYGEHAVLTATDNYAPLSPNVAAESPTLNTANDRKQGEDKVPEALPSLNMDVKYKVINDEKDFPADASPESAWRGYSDGTVCLSKLMKTEGEAKARYTTPGSEALEVVVQGDAASIPITEKPSLGSVEEKLTISTANAKDVEFPRPEDPNQATAPLELVGEPVEGAPPSYDAASGSLFTQSTDVCNIEESITDTDHEDDTEPAIAPVLESHTTLDDSGDRTENGDVLKSPLDERYDDETAGSGKVVDPAAAEAIDKTDANPITDLLSATNNQSPHLDTNEERMGLVVSKDKQIPISEVTDESYPLPVEDKGESTGQFVGDDNQALSSKGLISNLVAGDGKQLLPVEYKEEPTLFSREDETISGLPAHPGIASVTVTSHLSSIPGGKESDDVGGCRAPDDDNKGMAPTGTGAEVLLADPTVGGFLKTEKAGVASKENNDFPVEDMKPGYTLIGTFIPRVEQMGDHAEIRPDASDNPSAQLTAGRVEETELPTVMGVTAGTSSSAEDKVLECEEAALVQRHGDDAGNRHQKIAETITPIRSPVKEMPGTWARSFNPTKQYGAVDDLGPEQLYSISANEFGSAAASDHTNREITPDTEPGSITKDEPSNKELTPDTELGSTTTGEPTNKEPTPDTEDLTSDTGLGSTTTGEPTNNEPETAETTSKGDDESEPVGPISDQGLISTAPAEPKQESVVASDPEHMKLARLPDFDSSNVHTKREVGITGDGKTATSEAVERSETIRSPGTNEEKCESHDKFSIPSEAQAPNLAVEESSQGHFLENPLSENRVNAPSSTVPSHQNSTPVKASADEASDSVGQEQDDISIETPEVEAPRSVAVKESQSDSAGQEQQKRVIKSLEGEAVGSEGFEKLNFGELLQGNPIEGYEAMDKKRPIENGAREEQQDLETSEGETVDNFAISNNSGANQKQDSESEARNQANFDEDLAVAVTPLARGGYSAETGKSDYDMPLGRSGDELQRSPAGKSVRLPRTPSATALETIAEGPSAPDTPFASVAVTNDSTSDEGSQLGRGLKKGDLIKELEGYVQKISALAEPARTIDSLGSGCEDVDETRPDSGTSPGACKASIDTGGSSCARNDTSNEKRPGSGPTPLLFVERTAASAWVDSSRPPMHTGMPAGSDDRSAGPKRILYTSGASVSSTLSATSTNRGWITPGMETPVLIPPGSKPQLHAGSVRSGSLYSGQSQSTKREQKFAELLANKLTLETAFVDPSDNMGSIYMIKPRTESFDPNQSVFASLDDDSENSISEPGSPPEPNRNDDASFCDSDMEKEQTIREAANESAAMWDLIPQINAPDPVPGPSDDLSGEASKRPSLDFSNLGNTSFANLEGPVRGSFFNPATAPPLPSDMSVSTAGRRRRGRARRLSSTFSGTNKSKTPSKKKTKYRFDPGKGYQDTLLSDDDGDESESFSIGGGSVVESFRRSPEMDSALTVSGITKSQRLDLLKREARARERARSKSKKTKGKHPISLDAFFSARTGYDNSEPSQEEDQSEASSQKQNADLAKGPDTYNVEGDVPDNEKNETDAESTLLWTKNSSGPHQKETLNMGEQEDAGGLGSKNRNIENFTSQRPDGASSSTSGLFGPAKQDANEEATKSAKESRGLAQGADPATKPMEHEIAPSVPVDNDIMGSENRSKGEDSVSLFNNEEELLEDSLMDFCSSRPIFSPVSDGNSSSMALTEGELRWKELQATWKHTETMRVIASKYPTKQFLVIVPHSHSVDDESRSDGSVTARNEAISHRPEVKLQVGFELKLRDPKRWANRDGFAPHHGETGIQISSGYLFRLGRWPTGEAVPRHSMDKAEGLVDSLLEKAAQYKPALSFLLEEMVAFAAHQQPGDLRSSTFFSANIKTRSAIERKAKMKYEGDLLCVKDCLRGQIVFPDEASLVCGILRLEELCREKQKLGEDREVDIAVVRVKNSFEAPLSEPRLPTGYRHLLLTVSFDDIFLGEIQLQLLPLFDVFGEDFHVLHQRLRYGGEVGSETKTGSRHEKFFSGLIRKLVCGEPNLTSGVKVPLDKKDTIQPATSADHTTPLVRGSVSAAERSSSSFSEHMNHKLQDVMKSMINEGVKCVQNNPNDISSFHCLLDLLFEVLSHQAFKAEKERRVSPDRDYLDFFRNTISNCLDLCNFTNSTSMFGWVALDESKPVDRIMERPLDLLHNFGCVYAELGLWQEAEDMFRSLLLKCEQHLPLYHPRVLSALLDIAIAERKRGRTEKADVVLSQATQRLSWYLHDMESMYMRFHRQGADALHPGGCVAQRDVGRESLQMMEAFASQLQTLLKRKIVDIVGPASDVILLNYTFAGDVLVVLANCLKVSESSLQRISAQETKAKENLYYWRMAFAHYRTAFKGYNITDRGEKPLVAIACAGYGSARCLRELGESDKALSVLSAVIGILLPDGPPPPSSSPAADPEVGLLAPVVHQGLKMIYLPHIAKMEATEKESQQFVAAAYCLWLMAAITVDAYRNEQGRVRSLKLLQKASASLQYAARMLHPSSEKFRAPCISLLRKIEEEARTILNPPAWL